MNTALLVIDVQAALFESNPPPGDADGVIQRINALAERARALSVPVIYVHHERAGTPLAADSPGWQLVFLVIAVAWIALILLFSARLPH